MCIAEGVLERLMTTKERRGRPVRPKKVAGIGRGKELGAGARGLEGAVKGTSAERSVESLLAWRARNGLSQRQAIAVMWGRDFPLKVQTLQAWEQGRYKPERLAGKALATFSWAVPGDKGCAGVWEGLE